MFVINEGELGLYAEKIVPKLWGTEFWLVNTELYCAKLLKIIPGFECSVHWHKKKDETFIGIAGTVVLDLYDNEKREKSSTIGIGPGDSYRIAPRVAHSFHCHNVSWILEVSTQHNDVDVVRVRDSRKLES